MPQLTITLDDALLSAAQAYAQQHDQDLNALVSGLLQAAVVPVQIPSERPTRPLSPRIQRLYGALKVPADFDYRTALGEALEERFGI